MQSLSPNLEPLQLDILLPGFRITGFTAEVDERRRIGDLLNAPAESLTLTSVSIHGSAGMSVTSLPEALISKRAIAAVIPRETEEYRRRRSLGRIGVAPRDIVPMPVLCLVPPAVIRGTAHRQATAANRRGPDDFGDLSRFFPLTNATIQLSATQTIEAEFMLVNKEHATMIARLPQEGERRQAL